MSNRTTEPLLPTVFTGLVGIIPAFIIAIYFMNFASPLSLALASIGGLLMLAGNFYYFKALRTGDVSDMTVLAQTNPLFVFALSIIFLNQTFTVVEISGFLMLLLGGLVAAGRNTDFSKLEIEKATLLILFSTLLFAGADIFLKASTGKINFWMAYSAALFGRFGGNMALLAKQNVRESISEMKKRKTLEILIPGRVFALAGFLTFMIAIEIGKVSLLTALLNIRPIIVMISLMVFMKAGYDYFEEEDIGWRENLLRIASVILFVIGVLLLK